MILISAGATYIGLGIDRPAFHEPFAPGWTLPAPHAVLEVGGTGMAYGWDPRRSGRARLIRLAAAVALGASAITVPVAALLVAAPT